MEEYILGFKNLNVDELTQFSSAEEADYDCEEWCRVKANSLEEAKEKYEDAFREWQKKEGLVI